MKIVETYSHSRYMIDEKEQTFMRVPGVDASSLVYDSKPIKYEQMITLRKGLPMEVLWLDEQGNPKIRRTTMVMSISEVM